MKIIGSQGQVNVFLGFVRIIQIIICMPKQPHCNPGVNSSAPEGKTLFHYTRKFKGKILESQKSWRYQRGNQNPYIEDEQTTQWPKEKVQKDKQRSTKHTYKTKDRVTRTPLKTGGELRCSGRVGSSCSTSDT